MKIINPSIEILNPPDYHQVLAHIENSGRTCYQSEPKGNPELFIKRLISSGHESVLEHDLISVRFICDRGVSHELVRHRLCSFSQESTRYCNYSGDKFGKELTFIRPVFWKSGSLMHKTWEGAMKEAKKAYLYLLNNGAFPQEARSVLPNSLKTDIVVTANIRQWRLIFKQRCAPDAHPQMRQVMIPLLRYFLIYYNVFFQDLHDICVDGEGSFHNKGWQIAEVK